MVKNYLYPRVEISTTALKHSNTVPEGEDTTRLFVPLLTKKGPDGEVTKVRSLSEFISIFGELDYATNGQMALNLYNWLNNGGMAYIYRMNHMIKNDSETKASATVVFDKVEAPAVSDGSENVEIDEIVEPDVEAVVAKAKYYGEYYNNLKLQFVIRSKDSFALTVYEQFGSKLLKVEQFPKVKLATMKSTLNASEYITDVDFSEYTTVYDANKKEFIATTGTTFMVQMAGANDVYDTDLSNVNLEEFSDGSNNKSLLQYFWEAVAPNVLMNKIAYPIDMIMDAGYPKEVKKAMFDFINNSDLDTRANIGRDDIIGIFDVYTLNQTDSAFSCPSDVEYDIYDSYKSTNVAFYNQYFKAEDINFHDGAEIFVTPSYFLSSLIPHNDQVYGIQFATAGLRRAVLEEALYVNKNPLPDEKDEWFRARVNYVEKTPREYAFMSQRTHDGSDDDDFTALSFLNNIRCLEKMKKDIEAIGRNYLFEFNDSVTLSQMSTRLNTYITNWITNRTLASGTVEVNKNPYSDEAVDIILTIRFNGTIEVISVDITIE